MKVFQLSDYEWFYAESLDEAFAAALDHSGMSRAEYEQDFTPRELSEEEMDAPNEVNLAEDDSEPAKLVSFREALDLELSLGFKSGFLCGRES